MGIDSIFGSVVRRVRKEMQGLKSRGRRGRKELETLRIKLYDRYFADRLKALYRGFPNIDRLPPYVREMLEARIGTGRLRLALGRIKGALRALGSIRDDILYQLGRSRESDLYKIRRRYLARVFDVLRSLEDDIRLISYARSQLRKVPPIKEELPVVVLAGFPNAGKSTLLRELTGSEPEIAPYPFTTKRLLLGHFSDGYRLIQVVDTPGILDRPFDRMKPEEREAVISMKYLADLIVFLIDPFQDVEAQVRLLRYLKGMFQKPFLTVVGKADLLQGPPKLPGDVQIDAVVSPLTGKGVEELKKKIKRYLEGIKWR